MALQQDRDAEVLRLRAENDALADELAQCQGDKEFVWSLWKRLQVANPDITQAVSMVVQREKEKAEIKDRKVLEILQMKDTKIRQLEATVVTQGQELNAILQRKVELQNELDNLEKDKTVLTSRTSLLEDKLQAQGKRDTERDNLHQSKVQQLREEKQELANQVSRLREELLTVKGEKADAIAVKINVEEKIKVLQKELKEVTSSSENQESEVTDLKVSVKKWESQVQNQNKMIKEKNKELEAVRRELSELWENHSQCGEHAAQQAELIRQLQTLQQDTQKMLHSQESAYSMEAVTLKKMYDELDTDFKKLQGIETKGNQQVLELKKQLMEKEEEIADLKKNLEEASSPSNRSFAAQASLLGEDKEVQTFEPDAETEYRMQKQQEEIEALREKIKEKNRIIGRLERDPKDLEDLHISPIRGGPSHVSTPSRSRSQSPRKATVKDLKKHLDTAEMRLEETQRKLEMKNKELDTVRSAHDRRLDRLHMLQKNYRLVKDQLQTHEDEQKRGVKRKKISRPDPKSLQRENSDSVWNEVAVLRRENKNLLVERINLQEEVDTLRVQAGQDNATIHELKSCLQQEKEELQFLLKEKERSSTPKRDLKEDLRESKEILEEAREQLRARISEIQQLESDVTHLQEENEQLLEDKRTLKSEINQLKQSESERRIEIANLQSSLHRLQLELRAQADKVEISKTTVERLKTTKKSTNRRKGQGSSPVAKQYQKTLNRSIEKMKHVFRDFNQEGWESISTESIASRLSDSESSGTDEDSLGQAIVQTAQDLKKTPRRRKKSHSDDEQYEVSTTATNNLPKTCDIGTSPLKDVPKIRVLSSKVASGGRQLATMKTRVTGLQRQIQMLRTSRAAALKSLEEQRESHQLIQADLNAANQKIKMMRQNMQKLSLDFESLQEKNKLLEERSNVVETDSKHTEQEWRHLENRLKVSSAEVSRQSTLLKAMRGEREELEEQIQTLQEKVNRLERDNAQKRTLVEDMKLKMKIAQENMKSDSGALEEMEIKMKTLQDVLDKTKIYNESLRRRLSAITKEKHEAEEQLMKTKNDLEKKTKLLTESQSKLNELQKTVVAVETAARQQLHGLAGQSEAAMEAAQTKLNNAHMQINEHQRFVKSLAQELLRGIHHARAQLKQQLQREEKAVDVGESLRKAQRVARGILNISQSELEDLMLSEDEDAGTDFISEAERRKDKKWNKQWEKLLKTRMQFSVPLVDLFTNKIEERIELTSKLRGR